MAKGERFGKYNRNTYGTPHHLHPKDWGDKRRFEGADLNTYAFRDPDTGVVWHIHASNFETAENQARIRGWKLYRRRKK